MKTPMNLSPGVAAAYLLLVFLLVSAASNVIQFQQQSLRGRSDDIDAARSSHTDSVESVSQRNLLETFESAIPSYEEILNIFNRNANGRKKNKRKKERKKRRRKNNNDNMEEKKFVEYTGKNEELGFVLKLWWFKGIKYEQRGTDWCVMCPGKDGCEKNSPVVTNHCNPNDPDMRWEFIHIKNGGGQLKTKHHNLCLEMQDEEKPFVFRLQKCDDDFEEERQMFTGLRYDGKFKLHPYKRRLTKSKQCMTMLHHPLAKKEHNGEEIIDQPCHKPERTQTVFWEAEFRPQVEEDLGKKNYRCSAKGNRCKECQGECSDDADCEEGLKCFRRNGEGWRIGVEEKTHPNPWAEIPGCSGMGMFGRDYCYDPNKA